MLYEYLLCSFLALSSAAVHVVDPSILEKVFGKPTSKKIENTTPAATFTDSEGDSCQCVPYWACDSNLNAVNLNDPTRTGYGMIDVRYGEYSTCQESVERCCKIPKINKDVSPPAPDASRLKGCGYSNRGGLDFKTIGHDNEAQLGEFPWVMAILDSTDSYYGGGVLIHPQVVMTAAHIVYDYKSNPSKIKVRAGEWDTLTTKERLQYQERSVSEIRIHEDFVNVNNLRNDMALLRLAEPVQLADHINVICLPQQDERFDDHQACVANGWGKDVFGAKGKFAAILKKVELDMVSSATCQTLLRRTRLGRMYQLHSSLTCAGGKKGVDTCQGDGGAPLTCPIGDDRYKLSGLVAGGIGCGNEGIPALYARVSSFRHWIDAVVAGWGYNTSVYNV